MVHLSYFESNNSKIVLQATIDVKSLTSLFGLTSTISKHFIFFAKIWITSNNSRELRPPGSGTLTPGAKAGSKTSISNDT